ncbi:MAG: VOC family protein [Acidobacteriaceae bacterium]
MNVIRDRKIDYIEFPSTDIEATKAFYQKVFGWSFEDYGAEYTSFSDGRIAGGFQKAAQSGSSGTLIVVFVDDLQAAEQSVKAAGGVITK